MCEIEATKERRTDYVFVGVRFDGLGCIEEECKHHNGELKVEDLLTEFNGLDVIIDGINREHVFIGRIISKGNDKNGFNGVKTLNHKELTKMQFEIARSVIESSFGSLSQLKAKAGTFVFSLWD